MKILITGANGFIGKNLLAGLNNRGYNDILSFDLDTDKELLDVYTKECQFVFHLAGVNRPQSEDEFHKGNADFTKELVQSLERNNNKATVLMSSSIQADRDNPYGKSKWEAEKLLASHKARTGATVLIYRLSNVFGKWSKPNYNTVVATYCYNLARNLEIKVNDPETVMSLCYIDDVIEEFIAAMEELPVANEERSKMGIYCQVTVQYSIKLGELADRIKSFQQSRKDLCAPNVSDALTKKLYSTYLSFLPEESFVYDLRMNIDHRGSFTEFLKTSEWGQVSINISKSGVVKGNHWHHTKTEKFLVVGGKGLIRMRKIDTNKVVEYEVCGEKLQVVDIPVGYTHSIVNTGKEDLITIIWVNEQFNPEKQDTWILEV